MKGGSNMPKIF